MAKSAKKTTKKRTCPCGEAAAYFHSGCCGCHFEGVVGEDDKLYLVCELCGNPQGTMTMIFPKANRRKK